MKSYKVGEVVASPSPDGVVFDVQDNGGILLIKMGKPTAEEVRAFKSGLSFRFTVVEDIIFLLVRMGRLQWMDAPYYKYLSQNLTQLNTADDGEGLAITAMLIDADTGVLKALKLISLDTDTIRRLTAAIMMQPEIPDYNTRLYRVMSRYTTEDLVRMTNS